MIDKNNNLHYVVNKDWTCRFHIFCWFLSISVNRVLKQIKKDQATSAWPNSLLTIHAACLWRYSLGEQPI